MKKLLFLCILSICFCTSYIYAANDMTTIVVNNTDIGKKGKMFNNKFLVPARDVLEAMGAEVSWNNESKLLLAKKDNYTVSFRLGSSKMTINTIEKSMEHIPVIYDNTTLIPANSISDIFDYTINYDEKNNIMFFSPKNYTYICTIMPANSFPKIIKNITNPNDEYIKLYNQAPEKIIYRNVTGMIIDYPANPFPAGSTIYNIDCYKDKYHIMDIDNDSFPELIIGYVSYDGRFDDYVVYTYKNNNLYYCGNIRNVLDCGPSDTIITNNNFPGVFVYDYRFEKYWQVIIENTTIQRGNLSIAPRNKN